MRKKSHLSEVIYPYVILCSLSTLQGVLINKVSVYTRQQYDAVGIQARLQKL